MSQHLSTPAVLAAPMWNLLRYLRPNWKFFSWSCFSSILNKVLDLMPPV
ncbi:uncharacterized protein METZ01_LOCUS251528, partial [marine metagenome]